MEFLKFALEKIGLTSWTARTRMETGFSVLSFHRVISEKDPLYFEANSQWSMKESLFVKILIALKDSVHFISSADIKNHFEKGYPLPPKSVHICFDDGWRDNFTYAFPHLKKMGIPASFFIATDKIGADTYFWQEALYANFGESANLSEYQEAKIVLNKNGFHFDVENSSESAYIKLFRFLEGMDDLTRKNIFSLLSISSKSKMSERLFLNEKELKEMHLHGMAIGGHGKSHTPLGKVESVAEEVKQSKISLEKILNCEIDSMSYPHGIFNQSIQAECQKAGYKLVFSSEKGINISHQNPLAIKRVFLPSWNICDSKAMALSERHLRFRIQKFIGSDSF